MTEHFPAFALAIHTRYAALAQHELFTVEPLDLFNTYLAAKENEELSSASKEDLLKQLAELDG